MKIKTILTSTFIIVFTALQAQTKTETTKQKVTIDQCAELKKENEELKKALNLNTPITSMTSNDIDFNVVKVYGNIKTQMVTIEILLTNKSVNKKLSFIKDQIKIITLDGIALPISNYSIPSNGIDFYSMTFDLSSNVPTKCTLSFSELLPTNKYIKLLNLRYFALKDGSENTVELKDLPITWK